jgi:hypothetical protein
MMFDTAPPGPWAPRQDSASADGGAPRSKLCLMRSKRSQELPTLLDQEGCGDASPKAEGGASGGAIGGAGPRASLPASSPPVESQEACFLTDDDDVTQGGDHDNDTGDLKMGTSLSEGYLSDAPSCGSVAPRGAGQDAAPQQQQPGAQRQQRTSQLGLHEGDSDDEGSVTSGDSLTVSGKRRRGLALPPPATAAAPPPHDRAARRQQRRRTGSGDGSNEPQDGRPAGGTGAASAREPAAAACAPWEAPAPQASAAARASLASMQQHYAAVRAACVLRRSSRACRARAVALAVDVPPPRFLNFMCCPCAHSPPAPPCLQCAGAKALRDPGATHHASAGGAAARVRLCAAAARCRWHRHGRHLARLRRRHGHHPIGGPRRRGAPTLGLSSWRPAGALMASAPLALPPPLALAPPLVAAPMPLATRAQA